MEKLFQTKIVSVVSAMIVPLLVAIIALFTHIYLTAPISKMLWVNVSGLTLALVISIVFLGVLLRKGDLKHFPSTLLRWLAGGMLFFILWGVFWAVGEELLTLWIEKQGYAGDMGASYFYTNMSGMGYAEGLSGLWGNTLKMGALGLVSCLISAPFCYLGVVARKMNN